MEICAHFPPFTVFEGWGSRLGPGNFQTPIVRVTGQPKLCEGAGRRVEDHADFPEGTVEICQFEAVKKE